ncbi:MAG: DUF6512 family protein [Oscillospiraceae bacterium]
MKLKRWHIAGVIFTLILGTLLHFTYDFSGQNAAVGIFSAVNESVWEHLKLLIIPIIVISSIEWFVHGEKYKNFIPVKLLSVLLGMATIVVIFYTYVSVTGENYLWADIGLFVLSVILAYLFSYKMLQTEHFTSKSANLAAAFGFILLLACVIVFTFNPPDCALFQDPISGTYGVFMYNKDYIM